MATSYLQDGGYADFEEALAELVSGGFFDERKVNKIDGDSTTTVDPSDSGKSKASGSLDPAVSFGAPLAASNRLREEVQNLEQAPIARQIRAQPRARLPIWAHALGFLISSIVGLTIGYYIVCWIDPELNFLNLSWPGLPQSSTSK